MPNVSRLKRGCDSSGLSFLCQDKTFFVKTKFPVTENQQSRLAAVMQRFTYKLFIMKCKASILS